MDNLEEELHRATFLKALPLVPVLSNIFISMEMMPEGQLAMLLSAYLCKGWPVSKTQLKYTLTLYRLGKGKFKKMETIRSVFSRNSQASGGCLGETIKID